MTRAKLESGKEVVASEVIPVQLECCTRAVDIEVRHARVALDGARELDRCMARGGMVEELRPTVVVHESDPRLDRPDCKDSDLLNIFSNTFAKDIR